MSYLSIALQRRIERRQMNQSDLAKQSGISKSYISRLLFAAWPRNSRTKTLSPC
ncbi:MAG: helix-turn-helix domain-containing protein [Verrucomicrobiota bacterium]